MHYLTLVLSVFGISLMEALSQISLKKGHYFVGAAGYIVIALMLALAYEVGNLSTFNTAWSAVSIINAAIIGNLVFDEAMGIHNYASMLLAALAVAISARAP
jgi:multidrug transporter EmrE-like cation transporter